MSKNTLIFLLACGVILAAGVVGFTLLKNQDVTLESSGMKKFASADELATYLTSIEETGSHGDWSEYPVSISPVQQEGWVGAGMGSGQAQKTSSSPVPSTASDGITWGTGYTTTNIQVQGVDEADFVKNDAGYIYIISGRNLVIVDAAPASDSAIVSTTTLPGQASEMFLHGDTLAVFYGKTHEVMLHPRTSAAPVPSSRPATGIILYDVSDRKNPAIAREVTVTGSYYDSRLIGNDMYVVTSENANMYYGTPVVPTIEEKGVTIATPEIYYYDGPVYRSYQYYTLSSFSLAGNDAPHAESFLAGYDTTLYVSKENVYLAYRYSTPVPAWGRAVPAMSVDEQSVPVEKTVIHRFSINGGNINYASTGTVPGHLLNQFSLDEYKDHLRVATTVSGWNSERSYQYNNVYVLDAGMTEVGRLEFIAPDESIYAARFMGDRLYLVTFKRIDPFFVIDLSNPKSPGILGKLKIPGYSDYLHPYDANYIIGIGKETEENQWGGVSTSGLKLALFDVTDVNNPILAGKVEIGEAGSDSEALRDHKAFLFDRPSGLLVLPVHEVLNVERTGTVYKTYAPAIWQGAYVFSVSPDEGFTLKGKVTHGREETPYSYWDSLGSVRRSILIGDGLFTISGREVVVSNREHIGEVGRIIPLPQDPTKEIYPYRIA
jgi:uncharacterized secreted protein with C-terminal beta-propeller domain